MKIRRCYSSRSLKGVSIFHTDYWSFISEDAKDFIRSLLKADPHLRPSSSEALKHPWLTGLTASDHNLLPEIRAYVARARLRRGIELVKLANRIDALKMREDDEDQDDNASVPRDAAEAAGEALAAERFDKGLGSAVYPAAESAPHAGEGGKPKKSLSNLARGAIFQEVVMAKVREVKEQETIKKLEEEAEKAKGNSP